MKTVAQNKKAYHNYFLDDKLEVGLELQGWEVKSIRAANVNMADSFIYFKDDEAYLKNLHISPYEFARASEQEPRRDRRILLHRHQIAKYHKAVTQKGVTCIATKIYLTKRGLVKAEIALATGKQLHDKKQVLKERDLAREAERTLRARD